MKALLIFSCTAILAQAAASDITIIPLKQREDLLAEVVELWWQGQGNLQQTHAEKPTEGMTKRMQEHLNEDSLPLCLIALKEDKLVGMVRLTDVWTTDPKVAPKIATHPEWTPWLCGLIVAAEHRKQGIANLLIKAAEEKARSFGHSSMYLGAGDGDKIAYYARHGYVAFDNDTFRGKPETLMKHIMTP